MAHVLRTVDFSSQCENGGGLSGPWWSVEEEVREAVGFDEFVDCGEDVLVAGDVFESCRTVFLDPIVIY